VEVVLHAVTIRQSRLWASEQMKRTIVREDRYWSFRLEALKSRISKMHKGFEDWNEGQCRQQACSDHDPLSAPNVGEFSRKNENGKARYNSEGHQEVCVQRIEF